MPTLTRARRAHFLLSCLLLALAACRDAPADGGAGLPGSTGGGGAEAVPGAVPPRRPTRKYILRRTKDRCEIVTIDGASESPPAAVLCPPDLEVNEHVRLTGKACMRESPSSPARDVPIVCPEPLRRRERTDREARDAGR
jgi:hypothetical protein